MSRGMLQGMTNFAELIDAGWAEHGERAEQVGERLASSLGMIDAPEQIEPFARLAAHVLGEHLGAWERGIALLRALRSLPSCDASGGAAIDRHVAALQCASGDDSGLAALSREDAACALAAAAAACAGRDDCARAIRSYERALELADPGLPDGSPALRALAVAGNNLAAALEEKPARTPDENAGMVAAARGGLAYWKRAGGWLEQERAELRLARSLTLAGEPHAGAQHAQRCLAICEGNEAPAFERFFAHYALAVAQRAAADPARFAQTRERALALLAQVPAEDQRWCEAERRELGE
jgi:hypothetical protein